MSAVDAFELLPSTRRSSRRCEDLGLEDLPGLDDDLARDRADPHVLAVGVGDPALRGAAAGLHVLVGAL